MIPVFRSALRAAEQVGKPTEPVESARGYGEISLLLTYLSPQ